MNIEFTPRAWEDFHWWAHEDRKTYLRLVKLIEQTCRDPRGGVGTPERLKHMGIETWSKRITPEHRMVYEIQDDVVVFTALRGHYWYAR